MGIRKTVATVTAHSSIQPLHAGFVLDEQGKEVQITAAMIQHTCRKLLSQCRRIKQ
jgi:hypothetical protein